MIKRKADYWNTIAKRWDKDQPQRLWRLYNDILNSDLINRWLTHSDQVNFLLKTDLFDEALGKGLCPVLDPLSHNMIGIDISSSIVNMACGRNGKLSGITADLCFLPFNAETFDIVISNSSLDHFETKHEIIHGLHEIHRVMRKGGKLIITLDNLMNPVIALRSILPFRLLNLLGLVPYYIGATLGPRRLRRIIENTGFKVDALDAVMHPPRLPAVLLTRMFEKYAGAKKQNRFLHLLMAFERLSGLPTRFLTGYFIAVKAVKH